MDENCTNNFAVTVDTFERGGVNKDKLAERVTNSQQPTDDAPNEPILLLAVMYLSLISLILTLLTAIQQTFDGDL